MDHAETDALLASLGLTLDKPITGELLEDVEVLTHFAGAFEMMGAIDINDVVLDDVQCDLATFDWEELDWAQIAMDWSMDELDDSEASRSAVNDNQTDDNQTERAKRPRLNEVERLYKYSWERHLIQGCDRRMVVS